MDGTAPGSAPPWLQRLGASAWLVVGIMLVLVGMVWLLGQTETITAPLIAGAVVGAVGGAVVGWLERRGLPRAAGAGVVMLGLVALGVLVAVAVLGGITSQRSQIDAATAGAVDKVEGWAADAGITSAAAAAQDVKEAVPQIGRTLLQGVAHGITGLTSLLVFLGFTAFIAFFVLKDGPVIARWAERHMGLPAAAAHVVTADLAHALRQYFLGLTIVGAFNALLVGLGALVLGVPLPATVALVTFLAGYVPIIGAWTAGAFAFALALSAQGTTAALAMAAIVFLANGPLQQLVQPIAFGATLQLNPLVVFVVTIAAGSLFGVAGLVLAAPLVSGAVHIDRHLAELRGASALAPVEGTGTPAVAEAAEGPA